MKLCGCSLQCRLQSNVLRRRAQTGNDWRTVRIMDCLYYSLFTLYINGSWLLEGTAVNISPYVIHRDPEYFSLDPEMFWPDRWIVESGSSYPSSEKMGSVPVKTSQAAFIPFSVGHTNCAGKSLALAEMRAVIVCLIQIFNLRFQEGYDTRKWEEEKADYFVMSSWVSCLSC